ncbi:MAG: shikimate kinase [Saprospiraceae bacterium]|nr:shikimate kinase [Saprospiraceae bacterium]
MDKHVFLVGFMGSGKTHWGSVLAEHLGCPFLDLDAFIEEGEGRSVSEIFSAEGETVFRVLEREYLRRLVALPPSVVATGGGAPCFSDNMAWMKQHGTTIYLKTSPSVLSSRLQHEKEKRPLLKGVGESELTAEIERRLVPREPFYEQAEIVLEYDGDEPLFLEKLTTAARNGCFKNTRFY